MLCVSLSVHPLACWNEWPKWPKSRMTQKTQMTQLTQMTQMTRWLDDRMQKGIFETTDSEWSMCPQFVWISIGTLAPYYRHLLITIITPHLGKLNIGSWGGQSDYMTWNESSQIFHNHIEVPSPGWKHLLVIPHLWHYANVWLAKCFYVDSWKLHIDYGLCAGVQDLLTVG